MIFRSTRLGRFSIDLIDSIDQLRGASANAGAGWLQEIDELVSRAKQVQQQAWRPGDDVTVVDDVGPVEIRQLLMPCVVIISVRYRRFCFCLCCKSTTTVVSWAPTYNRGPSPKGESWGGGTPPQPTRWFGEHQLVLGSLRLRLKFLQFPLEHQAMNSSISGGHWQSSLHL